MMNKTLIICTVLVVSLKTTMKKSGYDVRNVSDGRARPLFAGMEEDFVCEPYQGQTLFFFSVCILCV